MSFIKHTTTALSTALRIEADLLGDSRFANNRKRLVRQMKHGRLGADADEVATWLLRDRRGVRGEMAFAQMIEADDRTWTMIRTIGVQSAAMGTDPADALLTTADGIDVAVDVKTTEHVRGRLLIGMEKIHSDTVYVLIVEDLFGKFHYRGAMTFARAKELLDNQRAFIGSHETIWIDQGDLVDIETCVEEIAAKVRRPNPQ